jgi:hypothetical protein
MTNAAPLSSVLVQISKRALWAPLTVFVLHNLVAEWLGHEPYVDPAVHFFAGVAIAFFFWQSASLCEHYLGNLTLVKHALLALGLATLTAVAWECMEYFLSTRRESSLQLWRATLLRDLLLGVTGAALFVGAKVWIGRGKQSG